MLKRRAIVGRYQHCAGTGKKAAQNPGGCWRDAQSESKPLTSSDNRIVR